MPVTIEINGDTMVARLSGELDHHHTQKLREEIDRNVQKSAPPGWRWILPGWNLWIPAG